MKTNMFLLLAVLAAPASASLTGQPGESRWNILDLLPRKPTPAGAVDADARLSAAEKTAGEGQPKRAVLLYRMFIDECPADAACAASMDRARLGLGQALADTAPPQVMDSPAAKESVMWLEAIAEPGLRTKAEPTLQRMRALLTGKAAPASPSAEGLPSFQGAVAGASASGGAAFDGAASDKSPVSVSLSMRNGQPNEVSVSAGNWNVSVGQLGIGDRSGILAESPYVNIRRVTRSPIESAIDRRLELQAGVVNVNARYFGDDSGSSSFSQLSDMARRLGLPESSIDALRSRFAARDNWQSDLGILAGTVVQFGRATRVPLPFESKVAVDLAWSATALVKAAGYAPNAAANASAGVRVTLPSGHQGALIGGWTEEVMPVGHDLLNDLARGAGPKLGLGREGSPQATAVVSGPIPGTAVNFELGASQRWAATTVEQKIQAGLSSTIAGKPVQVRVSLKDEKGKSIEYGRRGAEVEATLTFAPGSSVYALCEKENISYGGVGVSNDGCMTGLRWTPGAAVTLNADAVFGGKDKYSGANSEQAAALAASIGRLGAAGLEAADRIAAKLDPAEGLDAAVAVLARLPASDVAAALDAIAASSLPAQTKELIAAAISRAANGADAAEIRRLIERELGPIPTPMKEYAAKRTLATEAIGLLSDPGFWDGAARSAVRAQILASVSELKVSVGPLGTLRLSPASTILLAGAARYNGSPVSPMTQDSADVLFHKIVKGEIGRAVGAEAGGDALDVANALINRSRDAFAAALETDVIARLPQYADRIALADRALSYLPPEAAARLRAQLGADLGLSNLDAAGVTAILRALPEQAARDLRANMAPAAAQAFDQALDLAAQSVRREVNRTVLQLMLASEEFDRLTVDRGLKPGDLGARMIAESFQRLDERNRRGLRAHRAASIERLQNQFAEESQESAVAAAGSAGRTLDALHSSSGWPAGLRVELDAATRAELVKTYGEDALAAAVARLAVSLPADGKANLVIGYDDSELGARLERGAGGGLRLTMGRPGQSPDSSLDTAMVLARETVQKRLP